MTDTRCIWLTREQRDEIDIQGFEPEIVAAWDAAPADPTEAVRKVFADDPWFFDEIGQRAIAKCALLALGYPRTEQA